MPNLFQRKSFFILLLCINFAYCGSNKKKEATGGATNEIALTDPTKSRKSAIVSTVDPEKAKKEKEEADKKAKEEAERLEKEKEKQQPDVLPEAEATPSIVRRLTPWETLQTAPIYLPVASKDPVKDVVDPAKDPAVVPAKNPVVDPAKDPAVVSAKNPVVDPAKDPAVVPAKNPVVDPAKDPAVVPAKNPVVDPAKDPAVVPAKNPVVDPAKDPAVVSAKNPVVDPAKDPAVVPAKNPVVDPAKDPAVVPAKNPVVDPEKAPPPAPAVVLVTNPYLNDEVIASAFDNSGIASATALAALTTDQITPEKRELIIAEYFRIIEDPNSRISPEERLDGIFRLSKNKAASTEMEKRVRTFTTELNDTKSKEAVQIAVPFMYAFYIYDATHEEVAFEVDQTPNIYQSNGDEFVVLSRLDLSDRTKDMTGFTTAESKLINATNEIWKAYVTSGNILPVDPQIYGFSDPLQSKSSSKKNAEFVKNNALTFSNKEVQGVGAQYPWLDKNDHANNRVEFILSKKTISQQQL